MVVSPTPNPQAGGPPLVSCPRLLIQYSRRYPPYLEAFPPSATWGSFMLWWQGTYLTWMLIVKRYINLTFSQCDSEMNLRQDNLLNYCVSKRRPYGRTSGSRPVNTRFCPSVWTWLLLTYLVTFNVFSLQVWDNSEVPLPEQEQEQLYVCGLWKADFSTSKQKIWEKCLISQKRSTSNLVTSMEKIN
jgi:hypothetical protein